jgi:hypothetical protein
MSLILYFSERPGFEPRRATNLATRLPGREMGGNLLYVQCTPPRAAKGTGTRTSPTRNHAPKKSPGKEPYKDILLQLWEEGP